MQNLRIYDSSRVQKSQTGDLKLGIMRLKVGIMRLKVGIMRLKVGIMRLKVGIMRLKMGISETQNKYFWDSK